MNLERAQRWLASNPKRIASGTSQGVQQRLHDSCSHVGALSSTVQALLEELDQTNDRLARAQGELAHVRKQAFEAEREQRVQLENYKARFANAREECIRLITSAKELLNK
jgi:flagellar basal body rod protein FlgF